MIESASPETVRLRILVATDFSVRSDRALRRATLVASKLGAHLTLVHVVDADRPQSLIAADRAAAVGLLQQLSRTLCDIDGVDADWLVQVDDVFAGILTAAEASSADLIVIGPHRSRLSDVFVGTTAERVVRRSSRPLLVAIETPVAHHRRTLLALDFDQASKNAARKALAMGVFDHTGVVVMHAFDAPGEGMMKRTFQPAPDIAEYVKSEGRAARSELKELLAELDLPPTSETIASINGSPARTILEAARRTHSDLLVLGTNQRKGFDRALVGSVTADVIRDARRDILIIPSEPEA